MGRRYQDNAADCADGEYLWVVAVAEPARIKTSKTSRSNLWQLLPEACLNLDFLPRTHRHLDTTTYNHRNTLTTHHQHFTNLLSIIPTPLDLHSTHSTLAALTIGFAEAQSLSELKLYNTKFPSRDHRIPQSIGR